MRSIINTISEDSIVVFQFPLYPRMYQMMLRQIRKKSARIIVLLTDIDGLKDGDPGLLIKETVALRLFRYFIVHNPPMEKWLHHQVKSSITVQWGPFDFLCQPNIISRKPSHEICFAGNLGKSRFLEQLGQLDKLIFHTYGPDPSLKHRQLSNCKWHGVYSPYELPERVKGSFGLIWDGDSIDGPAGSLGHYMQFIFHHKLSLYILAGLPVIAPEFAGSASYIREKGIGWLVNNLHEIVGLLESISEDDYRRAQENMQPLAEEISEGRHLRDALRKLEAEMGNK